ncbi:MAG: phosphopyruvate hydratase [Candidatus Gottesmanbacteria bacterium]
MNIKDIHAREILDSKGHPTVEVDLTLENGMIATASVPSGASTGSTEAVELRDGDTARYFGKGVLKAVENVNTTLKQVVVGQDVTNQRNIDNLMIATDGTENKGKLGSNTIVAVSMAAARAAALSEHIPLYTYLGNLIGNTNFVLPLPQILILEGGKHGNWSTDIQEYVIFPNINKFPTFKERLRVGTEIFHSLGQVLSDKGYATGVGYEGAYCPKEMKSNEEAFQLMIEATEKAGYKMVDEILLGIDGAASEFFDNGTYTLKSEGGTKLTSRKWSERLIGWTKKYPLWSLEDIYDEEDWSEWTYLTSVIGTDHQIIGDDLLTTNVKRIQKAIDEKAINSVLIKVNQIGTVSETLDAIALAHKAGYTTVVSHRGGETNDDFIADLVVGTSKQSKFGGPDRGERIAKYNRLLRIEEEL